jgi:hypothetical protein
MVNALLDLSPRGMSPSLFSAVDALEPRPVPSTLYELWMPGVLAEMVFERERAKTIAELNRFKVKA